MFPRIGDVLALTFDDGEQLWIIRKTALVDTVTGERRERFLAELLPGDAELEPNYTLESIERRMARARS